MNQINNPPVPGVNPYDAGLNFDYAVWGADSDITMCNVNWDGLYKDVWYPGTASALDNHINTNSGARVNITNARYARIDEPIRINLPLNQALKYNYVRVNNPVQPGQADVQRNYYYFITSARHVNPSTTEITVQLDVWATYIRDVSINSAFVERGHIGVANSNRMANYGRDYLTVPEGLDLGSDYQIFRQDKETIIDSGTGSSGAVLMVINARVKTTSEDPYEYENEDGTLNLDTALGNLMERLPNGVGIWYFPDFNNFTNWILSVSRYPHITQAIMSLTVIPDPDRYYGSGSGSDNGGGYPWGVPQARLPNTIQYSIGGNIRNNIRANIPARYAHLDKFLTSPYCVLSLTTWTGNPVVLKPEQWASDSATVQERATLMPPNQRIVINPLNYNGGEGVAVGVQINNFPKLAVLNDMGIAYINSSLNTLNFQYSNLEYQGNKALEGNAVNYANTETSVDTSQRQALASAGLSMMGAGGNLAAGGAGAASGAAGSLLGAGGNILQNMLGNRGTMNIADRNREYADKYAQADYEQNVAAINARVQDAQMLQPSVSGGMGGETFNYANNMYEVVLQYRMIDQARIAMIGDYWLRYGYAVHRYINNIPANLSCMQRFTYWKMREVYMTGDIPEFAKATIRAILNKGVTVHTSPDTIGNMNIADNAPLGGISY